MRKQRCPRGTALAFLAYAVSVTTDTCILWPYGLASQSGYGRVWLPEEGRYEYAHRVAYELTHGTLPVGKHALHSCDTPRCFNPRHIFTGTEKDNKADMVKKGRSLIGQRNPQAKLTARQVLNIRERYRPVRFSARDLAAEFGVCRVTITRIAAQKSWGWLNG